MSWFALSAAFFLLAAEPRLSDPDHVHADNVQAFANTVAVARVASDRCPDILVNEGLLLDERKLLGLTAVDGPAIMGLEADMTRILASAIANAPSLQVWCDATYRNYGPEGRILPGLMKR